MSTRVRQRRDQRALRRGPPMALNIVSLIDVFAILVFYLLFNALSPEVLSVPRDIKLPASVAQMPPGATVEVLISRQKIFVDQQAVMDTAQVLADGSESLVALKVALQRRPGSKTHPGEVSILADKGIPYRLLKKIMGACADAEYGQISLVVAEKPSEPGV